MNGFAGRVGVVIEVAPNQFMSYRLRGDELMIEHEREDLNVWADPLKLYYGPTRVRIEVSGYVLAEEQTAPPSWAEEPQGEIEATRQLPAAPIELEG